MPDTPHITFVASPARLPAPPARPYAVLDVAFASGADYRRITRPWIDASNQHLRRWVDHHEHPQGWAEWREDGRFVLVPNQRAHAITDLIDEDLVVRSGPVEELVCHADFDGMMGAVKWCTGGVEPYQGADSDARAWDSPGRGHDCSEFGDQLGLALEVAASATSRPTALALMHSLVAELVQRGGLSVHTREQVTGLAQLAREREAQARQVAEAHGREEQPGLWVVRVPWNLDRWARKVVLRRAQERCPVGVVLERGGRRTRVTAATCQGFDLGRVQGLKGGRSDYRFTMVKGNGHQLLRLIARALEAP